MLSSSTCQIELHANLEWDSFGQQLCSRLALTYTSKCFAISIVSWWSISINMVTCTWIQVTMTYVQVGSSEEQKFFLLGEAPPVLHWTMRAVARQREWEQRATHEPWVQALPSLVPTCDTLHAEATMDRRWLRRHRVLRRWRHGVWPNYSCRKAGGDKTNLEQSGKSIALFFYVELYTNTILLRTFLQDNTLKCSVKDIERFRPRVKDDDTRSFLDVRF